MPINKDKKMKCIIINEEITEEECMCIQAEAHKKKNGKELPKKFKRVIGWNVICPSCKYHEKDKKK